MKQMQEIVEKKTGKSGQQPGLPKVPKKAVIEVTPNWNPKSTSDVPGSIKEKKLTTIDVFAVQRYRPTIEGGRALIEKL